MLFFRFQPWIKNNKMRVDGLKFRRSFVNSSVLLPVAVAVIFPHSGKINIPIPQFLYLNLKRKEAEKKKGNFLLLIDRGVRCPLIVDRCRPS